MGINQEKNQTKGVSNNCKQHIKTIQQLLMQIKLVEEEKQLLEEEIGALEQDKFGMNSTENQLRIKVQQLQQEIRMLKLQNSRFYQEIDYLRNGSGMLNNIDDNQRATNPNNVQQDQIIEELKFEYQNTKKSLILMEQQLQNQQETIYDLELRISTLMQEKQILLNLNKQVQQKFNNTKNQQTNIKDKKESNNSQLLQQIIKLKHENQLKIVEMQQKYGQKLLQATKKIQQITLNEQARKLQINQRYQTQILTFKENISLLQNSLKQKDSIIQKLKSIEPSQYKTASIKDEKSTKIIEGTIFEISNLITQKQHMSQKLSENLLPTLSKCLEQRQINSEKSFQEETIKLKSLISKQVQKTKTQIMKLGKPYHQKAIMINYFKPIQQMIV